MKKQGQLSDERKGNKKVKERGYGIKYKTTTKFCREDILEKVMRKRGLM